MLKVGKILEKKDFNVIYIRKDDNISWTCKKEGLLNRAEISNKNNAYIFVSIHMNSSKYEDVGGTTSSHCSSRSSYSFNATPVLIIYQKTTPAIISIEKKYIDLNML